MHGTITARSVARRGPCLQDGRAWPNYAQDYAALVDTAACARARVVAANAPRRYVSLVGRKGPAALAALPCKEAASLPHSSLLTPVSQALRNKIGREFAAAQPGPAVAPKAQSSAVGEASAANRAGRTAAAPSVQAAAAEKGSDASGAGECPYVGLRLSDNFLAAQGLWDACMADSILAALGPNSRGDEAAAAVEGRSESRQRPIVMHVCGKFHMEERLGICERLAERAPDVAVCTVVLVPVDLPAVRDAMKARPLAEYAAHEAVPGMPCSVERLQSLADYVVLTDGNKPRSF